MDISAPKHPHSHPDRDIDSEAALEPAFQAVVDAAVSAGWTEIEAAKALSGLAKAQIAAERDVDSEVDLEAAARSIP